jgi:hypothetical protein
MIDPDVGRRPQRTVCPEKGASKLRTGRPARKLDGKLFQSGGADDTSTRCYYILYLGEVVVKALLLMVCNRWLASKAIA